MTQITLIQFPAFVLRYSTADFLFHLQLIPYVVLLLSLKQHLQYYAWSENPGYFLSYPNLCDRNDHRLSISILSQYRHYRELFLPNEQVKKRKKIVVSRGNLGKIFLTVIANTDMVDITIIPGSGNPLFPLSRNITG